MRALALAVPTLLLCSAGCHSAGMEPLATRPIEAPAPAPDSPYGIDLVDASHRPLATYQANGRYYVLGHVGERYGIRVRNPTERRVEAVISVDGLDVIDGETASVTKRGYVIAPYADIVVDGFRTSPSHVAAFRFSSVARSYAGRKGKARNVGVIGVAVFAERAEAPLALPERQRITSADRTELDDRDADYGGGRAKAGSVGSAEPSGSGRASLRRRPAPPPAPRPSMSDGESAADEAPASEPCCGRYHRHAERRPGLGTEFGERRYSAVRFTRFVRADPTNPTAYAELRYNDAAGLAAMGIDVGGDYDTDEVTRRETAEPFPGQRFSAPPR